jgi:hypothetical protein
MLKKLLALTTVAAIGTTGALYAPSFDYQVGSLPASTSLDVKARDLSLVCPGGLYQSGGASGTKLGSFVSVGTPELASQFNGPDGTELVESDGVYTVVDPAGIATQGSALLNVGQIQLGKTSSISGLAGAACQRPSSDIWLSGGDTTTGHEALLILRNPTAVDATVDLEIFTEGGAIDAAGLNGISVVAGKVTVLPLASLVPRSSGFVTHVSAKGGAVAAWVQQRNVNGLTAVGVDYISPSAPAAKESVVPGIFIRGVALAKKLADADEAYADLVTTVRFFNPGTSVATVTAQIMGSNSKTFGTVIQQDVKPGAMVDVPLTELADGDYVALVNSNSDVLVSVRLPRVVTGSAPDFTWLASADLSLTERKITVPASGLTKLCTYNLVTKEIRVTRVTPNATLTIPASTEKVAAVLIVDINGAVANLPVLDQKNLSGKVSVSVH